MTRPSQKEIEQRYFQEFVNHFAVPDGRVIFDDMPDVIISGNETIGIEIANLYKQDVRDSLAEQVQIKHRDKVIKLAELLYLASNTKRIKLWVDFDPEYPITNIERSAKALAELASNKSKLVGTYNAYKPTENAPELRFISCDGDDSADMKWRPAQVYDVPSILIDRVRALVQQKTKKIKKYKDCDTYWLLLIVDC